jgi:tight adherence protein C
MIYIVVALMSLSVVFLVLGVGAAVTSQGRVVRQRLTEVRTGAGSYEALARRRRNERRQSLQSFLEAVGDRLVSDENTRKSSHVRKQVAQAGFRHPRAVPIYMGLRLLLMVAGLVVGSFAGAAFGLDGTLPLLLTVGGAMLGWMLPFMVLKRKVKARKKALNRGLADALDLMVVCVEAGLGVNQALIRVSEEMDRVSPEISDELTMVTLEMRAGTPRDEALRNLAARTENDDVRAWVNMMIQTDKFGTSIADSLRIHSDSLRTQRRQRAEEAAAKLTVKMIIPLALFIFPSMFVVVLGPVMILFVEVLGGGL